MGFRDFWKKLFTSEEDDAELNAARARHGIKIETPEEKRKREQEEKEPYDPWEEIRNIRSTFLLGSWVSRKIRIVGEDKVKAELEALRKKREAAEKAKGPGR